MMLTLTIDPALFESPEAAYRYARERRVISRLMQDLHRAGHLHSRRYFAVVEWQKDTEMIHFHVLIDATRVPKAAIDAAWSKNRPASAGPREPNRPAFGMTRFSCRRFKGGPEHAACYATKYLLKVPDHGWPAWVLAAGKEYRIPRYQTSRGFWPAEHHDQDVPAVPAGPFKRPAIRKPEWRSYRERIADCGGMTDEFLVERRADPATGEVAERRTWLRRWLPGELEHRNASEAPEAAAEPREDAA